MKKLGAEHENLDYKAHQLIKDLIMEHKLLPGEKIDNDKFSQDLGISRTPLISALKYLEQEKLVKAIPRRGYIIRSFSKQEMIYIFELREILEGLAARRASNKITDSQKNQLTDFFSRFKGMTEILDHKGYAKEDRRFHNFVIGVGGNEFINSILQTYNIIAYSYQLNSYNGLVRPPSDTIDEHFAIIKAICDRDSETAEKLMRLHLRKSLEQLKLKEENFATETRNPN
jgi:DNA-binding GntR family transcriptional regulator